MGQACCAQKELMDNRSYFNGRSQLKVLAEQPLLKLDANADPQVVEKLRSITRHQFKNIHLIERGEQRPLVKLEEAGCWYAGEWRGNMLHGIGTLLLHDGSIYNGSFVNSVAEG